MFVGLVVAEVVAANASPAEHIVLESGIEGMPAPVEFADPLRVASGEEASARSDARRAKRARRARSSLPGARSN